MNMQLASTFYYCNNFYVFMHIKLILVSSSIGSIINLFCKLKVALSIKYFTNNKLCIFLRVKTYLSKNLSFKKPHT